MNTEKNSSEYKVIQNRLSMLIESYTNLIPEKPRDRQLAHKDLDTIFSQEEYYLNLVYITRFLNEGNFIVAEVLKLTVGMSIAFLDASEIENVYKKSLEKSLIVE